MSGASAFGSGSTHPSPTSGGLGCCVSVRLGQRWEQTAAGPRAGACRLRRLGGWGDGGDVGRSPKRDTQGTGPLGGCGQSPPFSPRDGGGIWRSREGLQNGLRRGRAMLNILSEKGAFSPIRQRAWRRTCISIPCRLRSPVLPARLPTLPERQTAPQRAFPRRPAKIRRATQQRLCPTGANSVAPAPPQRPLPGRARQRRPTRAVPARHPSSTSAASARPALPSTPTSPPPNHRRRQAPARGPAAVCAFHRPIRNAKKHPCPLLVGHGRVDPEPTALAAGTAGLPATGCRHCRPAPRRDRPPLGKGPPPDRG